MKFGFSKCANIIVYRGILEPAVGILISTGKITDVEADTSISGFCRLTRIYKENKG